MSSSGTRVSPSLAILLTGIASFFSIHVEGTTLGQDRAPASLSVEGVKQITVEPTRLRLELPLSAEGRDGASAVKALAAHRAKVKESLTEMKADIASLEFSSSTLSKGIPGMQGQDSPYNEMGGGMRFIAGDVAVFGAAEGGVVVARDAERGGQEPQEDPIPKIFFASTSATVEWNLPTKDVDALLLLPQTLQSQVLQRDLRGKKNKVELTDDEKDLLMSEYRKRGMSGEEVDSGEAEIQIQFVGKISDQQYKGAVRDAFASAKKEAELLAEATGQKLGQVLKIEGVSISSESPASTPYQYGMRSQSYYQTTNEVTDRKITSSSSERMKASIRVMVTFQLN